MRSDSTKCTEELYKLHAIKIGFIIFTATTLPALPTNKNIVYLFCSPTLDY